MVIYIFDHGTLFLVVALACSWSLNFYLSSPEHPIQETQWSRLIELTVPIAARWHELATQLKLQPYIINEIRANKPNDSRACLSDALRQWFHQTPNASWEDMANALERIYENRLAGTIREEYCVYNYRKHLTCMHNETQYIISGIIFVREVLF